MFRFFPFVLSLLAVASSALAAPNYYDYIYRDNAGHLYNQTAIISQGEYISANATHRQDLLEREFLNRKIDAYGQVVSNVGWGMVKYVAAPIISIKTGLWAVPLGAAYFAPAAVVGPVVAAAPAVPVAAAAAGGGMGGNFILGQFFGVLWGAFVYPIAWQFVDETTEHVAGVISSIRRWWSGSVKDDLHALELAYVRNKQKYSQRWQRAIENNFQDLRSTFQMRNQHLQQSSNKDPRLIFADWALSLPKNTKPIEFDKEKLREKLSQYRNMESADAVEQLIYFCEAFAQSSRLENPHLKSPIYLYGAPATGKTEAVELMAEALGVQVITIKLSELQSVAQLRGTKAMPPKDPNSTATPASPGLIAEKLIELAKAGYDTDGALIFFDEGDRVLNQVKDGQTNEYVTFMLELTEGKTKTIDNPFFNAELNVRHLGIILAGNGLLNAPALQSRVDTVYFGGYSLEYRKRVARERFLPGSIKDYLALLSLADFSEQELAQIDAFAEREHTKMKVGKEIETEPGFRDHQRLIQRFVHRKANAMATVKGQ